ncbi:hypothetical protein MKY29_14235 [Psychrobacillus sp. FSL K6-2365]|uniref:hypothetical protein n=1 Tax=Psychrobacillus sp. FSL K6-2365 TaxID=2921546 RepID=UPI0030F87CEA
MFNKKTKTEVVPESEYTDFSHRVPGDAYATNKAVICASLVPTTAAIGLSIYSLNTQETYTSTSIPVNSPVTTPIIEPVNLLAQSSTFPVNLTSKPDMIPTGFIADTSLEMLANVLDPLVQIMVAISFPIASVIMIGGCFFFMIGNSEKAWQTIMNAGLGYVLIQLSPLFLNILREVGEAV